MAYDDGYYFGKCKLICEAETISDNGKAVSVTDGVNTFSGTIVDKIVEFMVPGRGLYTVTMLDNGSAVWTGKVEAGYGECLHVMLADGYDCVKEKQIMSAQEIAAATAGTLGDKVADADCVKALSENLTANGAILNYDVVEGDGVYINYKDGADTVRKKLGSGIPQITLYNYMHYQYSHGYESNASGSGSGTSSITFDVSNSPSVSVGGVSGATCSYSTDGGQSGTLTSGIVIDTTSDNTITFSISNSASDSHGYRKGNSGSGTVDSSVVLTDISL